MSRSDHIPKYRLHKQSGQGVVTLTDGLGNRKDVLLGHHGTKESKAEYERVIAEWLANGRRLPGRTEGAGDLTVNELAVRYLRYAADYYRNPDGSPGKEEVDMKYAIRPLVHLYGPTSAKDFGPLALKAVRQIMVKGYTHPRHGPQPPLTRGLINRRIIRVRRVFKWGIENELLPPSVLQGLQTVRGLSRGRSGAKEAPPVKPVAEAIVEDTLPHLPRQVAAMVQLQLFTGMRPGETIIMRAIDLDMTGDVWLYRPGSDMGPEGKHKTAHHGHKRIVAIGPRAQEVLRPFLNLDTTAYLFSPKEAEGERRVEQRQNRKTKVQPSQKNRRKRRPKRKPGDRYTISSYGHAVYRGCDKAFPPPSEMARTDGETQKQWLSRLEAEGKLDELKAWRKDHHWHPHQLRHTAATKLRREFGLDTARVVLGHRTPQITELYAEIDVSRAAEAMERLG